MMSKPLRKKRHRHTCARRSPWRIDRKLLGGGFYHLEKKGIHKRNSVEDGVEDNGSTMMHDEPGMRIQSRGHGVKRTGTHGSSL
jgi:hypothetical protein